MINILKIREILLVWTAIPLLIWGILTPDVIPKVDEIISIFAILAVLVPLGMKALGRSEMVDQFYRMVDAEDQSKIKVEVGGLKQTFWILNAVLVFMAGMSASYQNWNAMSGWIFALIVMLILNIHIIMTRRKITSLEVDLARTKDLIHNPDFGDSQG